MFDIKLIGTSTCPYVQRTRILLNLAKIQFNETNIDLSNKPDWFLKLTPTGKVPVLIFNELVIFESHIINDFILESGLYPQQKLYPEQAIKKALHKSWIYFCDSLITNYYQLLTTTSEVKLNQFKQKLTDDLEKLENILQTSIDISIEYKSLRMLDIAYAPFFMRMHHIEKYYPLGLLTGLNKISTWKKKLLSENPIRYSVIDNYESTMIQNILKKQGIASNKFRNYF